jgi:hypothetical protein
MKSAVAPIGKFAWRGAGAGAGTFQGKTRKELLKAHWSVMSAADFFTVEVMSLGGLQRYSVLVIMELCTRRVTIGGIVAEPTGQLEQVARGLVDGFGGALAGNEYLIHDRGVWCSLKSRTILKACEVEALKLPARAPPNLNAHLEKWIRESVRSV